MIDYINTNTFRDISDFVIMLNDNKVFTTEILKQNAIIYCKRDYVDYLFKNLMFSGRKYILITHASDFSVGKDEFSKKPPCVKKWYAQNVSYSHPDLIPIPIGLTTNKDGDQSVLDLEWFLNQAERFSGITKDVNLLYCNWTTQNNFKKRNNILKKFDDNHIKYVWDFPGFTPDVSKSIQEKAKLLKEGKSSKQEISALSYYYDYCNNLAKYKFVVSPPGNGIDCHRTWEALYTGSFPIVLKDIMYNEFNELPIIQVNDYSEVTYDLLYSYLDKSYNYEKIYMNYWKNRITHDFNNL